MSFLLWLAVRRTKIVASASFSGNKKQVNLFIILFVPFRSFFILPQLI